MLGALSAGQASQAARPPTTARPVLRVRAHAPSARLRPACRTAITATALVGLPAAIAPVRSHRRLSTMPPSNSTTSNELPSTENQVEVRLDQARALVSGQKTPRAPGCRQLGQLSREAVSLRQSLAIGTSLVGGAQLGAATRPTHTSEARLLKWQRQRPRMDSNSGTPLSPMSMFAGKCHCSLARSIVPMAPRS